MLQHVSLIARQPFLEQVVETWNDPIIAEHFVVKIACAFYRMPLPKQDDIRLGNDPPDDQRFAMFEIADYVLVKQQQIHPLACELLNRQRRRHDLERNMDLGVICAEIKQRPMTDGINNDRAA